MDVRVFDYDVMDGINVFFVVGYVIVSDGVFVI